MLSSPLQDVLHQYDIDTLPCRRILIVDDELANLEVLAALLEPEWEVYTAQSGLGALKLLASIDPVDLVIADQRMPGMTGVDLLVHIAKHHPETVRIVLTAYSDVGPMVDAVNRGDVYRFLLKPYEPVELRSIVADALQFKFHRTVLSQILEDLSIRTAELRKVHKQLRDTQEQLFTAERLSTLGRFTAGVTHEIRNQLTIMSLILQSVEARATEPEILKLAKDAWSGFTSFLELLQNVHSFARTKAIAIERRPLVAQDFVQSTLSLFKLEELGHHHEVEVLIEPHAQKLNIDREGMSQALLALLRNAALADPQKHPISIHLNQGQEGSNYFEICDLGCGMDSETLLRTNQPFFTGFKAWPGLGLGLEISRLIAKAHGGRLELQSSLGEGTTARLWFSNSDNMGRA